MTTKHTFRLTVAIGFAMTGVCFVFGLHGNTVMLGLYALFSGSVWASALKMHERMTRPRRPDPGS